MNIFVTVWEWFNTPRVIIIAVMGLIILALWVGGTNEQRKAREEEKRHD
jgi:hypothetical protein